MHPYRVFVSYSSEDWDLVEKLVGCLQESGLQPVWAKEFQPGTHFLEVIRQSIGHAHIFMPILTKSSKDRPWVQQEIGVAMGLEIPVLPVVVDGQVPDHMIGDLHAHQIDTNLIDFNSSALGESITALLNPGPQTAGAMFQTAPSPEIRAIFLARYTREALKHNANGPMRQAGAFSSFCLPKDTPDDPVWIQRDGKVKRSKYLHGLLQSERLAFEDYVKKNGCDLILDPSIQIKQNGPEARKIRLTTLLDFLKDDKIEKVRVVIRERMSPGSLTICGDWFTADSITPRPGEGYFGTTFSWHAPTVWLKAREFDRDFMRLMQQKNVTDDTSREVAINTVEKEIAKIDSRRRR